MAGLSFTGAFLPLANEMQKSSSLGGTSKRSNNIWTVPRTEAIGYDLNNHDIPGTMLYVVIFCDKVHMDFRKHCKRYPGLGQSGVQRHVESIPSESSGYW